MKRPNILWICTDQQRFDTLGCYGNTFVDTPHIDKLAQNGMLFENAYCQSTICTPSRASFLTGRYPRTNRMRKNGQNIPESEMLVTRLLHEAGYNCGLSGKLHLSACHPTVCHGTERRIQDGYSMFHWSHGPNDGWATSDYTQWLRTKGKKLKQQRLEGTAPVFYGPDAEDHQATWSANKAIEFIEAHEGEEHPWLFSVNIYAPHHPFDPPEKHFQKYMDKLEEIPLPNYRPGEPETKTSYQRDRHSNNGPFSFDKFNDRDHRMLKAAYWAMVDLIDEQVGRLVEALERTGQLDNTIIIFMSDHGELLGDHGMYLKGPFFYEGSVHIPLIISWPGHTATGARSQALVELVDLAPTLLEAAGEPVYSGMQGISLLPLLSGNTDEHRSSVFCEVDETGAGKPLGYAMMVRTKEHKLTLYHKGGEGELYDLLHDPEESRNLWNDSASSELKLRMMETLCRRMAEQADPLPPRIAPW